MKVEKVVAEVWLTKEEERAQGAPMFRIGVAVAFTFPDGRAGRHAYGWYSDRDEAPEFIAQDALLGVEFNNLEELRPIFQSIADRSGAIEGPVND